MCLLIYIARISCLSKILSKIRVSTSAIGPFYNLEPGIRNILRNVPLSKKYLEILSFPLLILKLHCVHLKKLFSGCKNLE